MPNKQTEKEIAKQKAIKGGFDSAAANNVFRMDPSKKSIVDAAGDPMKMSAMLQDLNVGEIQDLQSGNTIGMSSEGTSLNTTTVGNKTSSSETNNTSAGSDEFKTAFKNARGAGKTEFTFNGKSFNTNIAPASKTTTKNSSKPNVSSSIENNVSVKNKANPVISQQNTDLANAQFGNLQTEIGAISDSITKRNELQNLKTLGLLDKGKILSDLQVNKNAKPIYDFEYKEGFAKKSSLGPFKDDDTFFDYVSGNAADKARAQNFDYTKQNVNKQRVITSERKPLYGPNKDRAARFGNNAILGVIGDGSKNYSPTKTVNTTGFSYNDILEKSGDGTFKMGFKKY